MKRSGIITALALVAVLAMSVAASAQCTAVLADGLFPNGGTVQVGDTIEYLMTVSVPNVPQYCTLNDVSLYFFPPSGEADPCDNTGSGVLIASGLTLTPGGTVYTFTSADNAALAHVVTLGDLTDADGALVVADMATSFVIEGGTGEVQCDESSSVVTGVNPCIEVTKDACGFSKVGDEVTYTICVTNCSNPPAPLYNVIVSDPLLGGTLAGFPSELAPGQSECVDFYYEVADGDPDPLINMVSAQGEDEYGNMVFDDDTAEVDLLHPSFMVDVDCLTTPVMPGGDADFLVTIENMGDVALLISTDDVAIPPFTLGVGGQPTFTVTASEPGGEGCIPYEINVTATIPPEFCDLPNVLTDFGAACCPIDGPDIEITKEVDCDISSEGDEVIYTICVTNTSDPAATLYNVVVSDPLLGGDLGFPTELAAGATECMDFPYTIQAGDADPLENRVDVNAESEYGTAVSDYAEETVDLIHPSFTVTKECLTDPVSAGGDADFLITITNTGDFDLWIETDEAGIAGFALMVADPIFTQTVTVTDPGGVDCVFNAINVTATLYPDECEIGTELTGYAEACCTVEGPCIEVTKEVDCDISSEGDEVIYTICVTNCSDPAAMLYNVVVDDPLLGGNLGFPTELAAGQTVCMDFPYTIQSGDADPLENRVDASGESEYGTAVSDYDEAMVDLIHPSFTVAKECLTDPVAPGGDADFGITIVNTGDFDLWIETDEAAIAGFALNVGQTFMQTVTVMDPGGVDCVYNEINVTATLYPDECEIGTELLGYADACCPIEAGGEGCTPGYWKNQTECWECYTTGTPLGDVFTFPSELSYFEDDTLIQALNYGGGKGLKGKVKNLLRHAVAALHNACDPDVSYPMGLNGVINAVNTALATLDEGAISALHSELMMYNEYGCPQDAHCDPIEDDPVKGLYNDTLGEVVNPTETMKSAVNEKAFAQAVPNPFNESVRIQFGLPQSGAVSIDVYDVAGRHVANVMSEQKGAGTHEAIWNGTNSRGSRVPTGVYFYRLSLESETLLKKMLMID